MKTKEKLRRFIFKTEKRTQNTAFASLFLAVLCLIPAFIDRKELVTLTVFLMGLGFFIFFLLFIVFLLLSATDLVIGNVLARANKILDEEDESARREIYEARMNYLVKQVELDPSKANIEELKKWINTINGYNNLFMEVVELSSQKDEIDEILNGKNGKRWEIRNLVDKIEKENEKALKV